MLQCSLHYTVDDVARLVVVFGNDVVDVVDFLFLFGFVSTYDIFAHLNRVPVSSSGCWFDLK